MVARQARDQAGDLATTVEESVHGIRVLKAFGRGDDALDDFVRQADDAAHGRGAQGAGRVSASRSRSSAIPEAILAVSLGIGVVLTSRGELSVGALVAFFATAAWSNSPVERLGMLLAMTLDAKAATDRYLQVMDTGSTVPGPGGTGRAARRRPGRLARRAVRRALRAPAQRRGGRAAAGRVGHPRGIDLVLEPGETMALVGLTGSGKTTLLQLVPRLYDVTAGSVRIDGVDVRDLSARRPARSRVDRVRGPDPVLGVGAGERAAGHRPDRAGRRRPGAPRPSTSPARGSRTGCPTASTRSSARRG